MAAMELILDTYAEPPDPAVPLVCFDESGKELQAHTRTPQPMQPGTPARDDPTYTRHGSANLFIFCAPHLGWRQITVTAQRTKVDWAHAMRDLVDRHFPDAPRIIVVMDISTPIGPPRSITPFRLPKRGALPAGSTSGSRRSTAPGSTSPNWNCGCSAASASTNGCRIVRPWSERWRRGSPPGTRIGCASIGGSPPTTLVGRCLMSTPCP